jgi:hypothetical protein
VSEITARFFHAYNIRPCREILDCRALSFTNIFSKRLTHVLRSAPSYIIGVWCKSLNIMNSLQLLGIIAPAPLITTPPRPMGCTRGTGTQIFVYMHLQLTRPGPRRETRGEMGCVYIFLKFVRFREYVVSTYY